MKRDIRILMLEDFQDDAGLIERALKKAGLSFTSKRVDTGYEFVEALRDFDPDIILSDHALPQFNSIEALKICKKSAAHTPFILVTGTVSEEFAVSCLKEGADDYILKSNLVRLPSAILNSIKQKKLERKRIKTAKALLKQNEELVKINKELDSFVYSVSHNLRAPLMSVLGLLSLARMDDAKENGQLDSYFNMMEYSINRLDDTLKEILDYSRNARGLVKVDRISIKQMIEEGFERLKYIEGSDQIEKQIIVNDSVPFFSDPYRMPVILNNLISNAIKYRDSAKERSYIRIAVDVSETNATIVFQDNGIGVAQNLIDKIFDMFFRATDKSEGAGLGLYIVKETVTKLGGKVTVDSKAGEGVTFKIEIPNSLNLNLSQII